MVPSVCQLPRKVLMVATETMATLATPESDFTVLPQMPADLFTAPLKRPAHVGEDWLEPAQTAY